MISTHFINKFGFVFLNRYYNLELQHDYDVRCFVKWSFCFVAGLMQKRFRREKRARRRLQEQLELEVKRRVQMEDALRAAGAADQIRIINGK